MKILIVDDHPGALNALKIGLSSFGHQVITAKDGLEALKVIELLIEGSEPIELMVTDLRMPGMDGLELIESTRELIPELPVILMTAYGDDHVRKRVTDLQSSRYVEKPFNPDAFLKVVDEIKAPSHGMK